MLPPKHTTLSRVAVTLPPVLELLERELVRHDFTAVEGIFSVSQDEYATLQARDQLNRDVYEQCDDVHVVAALVKVSALLELLALFLTLP